MQISVTFRHRESDEGVKDYVRDRVEKLEKYLENPMEIHVVLTSEKFRQIAEITVVSDGVPLNSQGRDNDLYAAIDQMVDKLERQLRERRGKIKKKRVSPPPVASTETEETVPEEREEGAPLIQRHRILVKPMSVEEAVSQLDLLPQHEYIFINAQSGLINVLSRRKDGGYDWIEPYFK
jgi:putative sigma-54 modulation protein